LPNKVPITVTVNGRSHSAEVEPRTLLVHFLRETLNLTGTKIGCDTSQCGACVVRMNGVTVKSCTAFAVQADGAEVTTIEGLAQGGNLTAVQEAFWNKHGLQCGFCTPGLLMTLYEFLQNPKHSDEEIRTAMSGVICRCTGYVHIVEAVKHAIATVEALSPEERKEWFPV